MGEMTLVEKYNHELYHHGTKGMKWGVRRYQNPDGSLTAAGKKRYGTKANFERVQAAKKAAAKHNSKAARDRRKAEERTAAEIAKYRKKMGLKDDTDDTETKNVKATSKISESDNDTVKKTSVVKNSKKNIYEMSDDELREATSRWRAEKDYIQAQKDLATALKQPMSEAEKRRKNAEEAAVQILTNSLKNIGGQTVTYMMGTAVNKLFKDIFDDPKIINPKKGQKD